MQPLSVLLLAPEPCVPGGVSAFAGMLRAHAKSSSITNMYVGHAGGHRDLAKTIIRLLFVPLKVVFRVWWWPIDVVHINPSLDAKALIRDGLILLALRCIGFRHIVVFFHGWDWSIENEIQKRFLLRLLFVRMLRGATRIVVLAPEFKTALESLGLEGKRIIVGSTMFDAAALKSEGVPPARRKILFLSRFDRRKGVYEVLDAFFRIASEFPDTDLIMAGDGREMKELKARVARRGLQNRVSFPGYVRGNDKAELLASCALLALPTTYPEGMPIVLLEAMGVGRPVLTSRIGGIARIVQEPDNGIILDNVTADSVTAALRRLLGSPEFCKTIGEYNALYARRFEAAVVTKDIEDLYWAVARE